MPIELRTERLRLRQWLPSDREPFARLNADARVMEYFPSALSRDESDAFAMRLETHLSDQGWGLWAIEIPNVTPFAGFIGLSTPRFQAPFTPCVEIGWRLAAEYWGCGFATEGARAALSLGFRTLALKEVVSFTTAGNRRSQRVMERLGMTRNSEDDFEHPSLPVGHPLRPHVLYRVAKAKTA